MHYMRAMLITAERNASVRRFAVMFQNSSAYQCTPLFVYLHAVTTAKRAIMHLQKNKQCTKVANCYGENSNMKRYNMECIYYLFSTYSSCRTGETMRCYTRPPAVYRRCGQHKTFKLYLSKPKPIRITLNMVYVLPQVTLY